MRPTADSEGLAELGKPARGLRQHSLSTTHPALGTMAAVAAASAELLIIGWYIFRVLLQVSVPGFRVGEGVLMRAPEPASPRRNCRLLYLSYLDCRDPCLPECRGQHHAPPPAPCALLLAQTLLSAPAPGREQRVGARRAPAANERRGS